LVRELVGQGGVRVVVVLRGGDVFLEYGEFGQGGLAVVRIVGADYLDVVYADGGVGWFGGGEGAFWGEVSLDTAQGFLSGVRAMSMKLVMPCFV
jgi:hypothetical protein